MSDEIKIGLAMIARNAEEHLWRTLSPFIEDKIVDEVCIVLGGLSDDNTAGIAEKLATLPVLQCEYYDEDGRLTRFAEARQMSFDALTEAGCTYALVVDVEEKWIGLEHLRDIVAICESSGFPAVLFLGKFIDGMRIEQLRLYKLGMGEWKGWCHNFYDLYDPTAVCFKTDRITFFSSRATADLRREQNIKIAERYLEENGDDPRVLFHIIGDLLGRKSPDEIEGILDYCARYIVHTQEIGYKHLAELAEVHYMRAGAWLFKHRYADAFQACMMSLSVMQDSRPWATMAEAAGHMSVGSMSRDPLLYLTIFCADQAIALGHPRSAYTSNVQATLQAAYYYKAGALTALQRFNDALGALDHALLYGKNKLVEDLHATICKHLGVLSQ